MQCCTGHGWAPIPFYQSSCSLPYLFKSPFFTVPIPFSPNSLPLFQFPPFHPSVNTSFLLQFSFSLLFQAPYSLISLYLLVSKTLFSSSLSLLPIFPLSQWLGHPRVLGIPLSKTLVIWASPVTLTLIHIAKVIWEGDAHITRVLGMGMPKTQGCSYHCNTASFHPLLSWCIPFYFPAPSLFFIPLFILLFSWFPPPTPTPPSPSLFLRHWHLSYCHRFLKFPVFSGEKISFLTN